MTTVCVLSGTCLAIIWREYRKKEKAESKRFTPIAPSGFFEAVKKIGGDQAPFYLWHLAQQMGEVCFRLPIPVGIGGFHVVGDPEVARNIFMDRETSKPRDIYKVVEAGGLSKTLFSSASGSYAKSVRKTVAPAFSKMEVERMNGIALQHVDDWMKNRLKDFADKGETFDPGYEMIRLTFLIINEAAFEYKATDEDFRAFTHHTEKINREFALKQLTAPWRKVRSSPMLPSSLLTCDCLVLRLLFNSQFFGPFIAEVRSAVQSTSWILGYSRKLIDAYEANPEKSLHTTIIKVFSQAGFFESKRQHESELAIWIAAGQDTTGYALSNALIEIAKQPQVQQKLREALLGSRGTNAKDISYFRNVVQECIRMTPSAAMGSARQVGRDFQVGNGKVIPEGAICWLNQYLCNRNPEVFENPEEFCPERWDTASKAMRDAMMTFAAGPRNCPGQYLATAEINSILPRILSEYSLELVDEGRLEYFITLKYRGSKVRAKKL